MKTIMIGFDNNTKKFFVQKDGVVEYIFTAPVVLNRVADFLMEETLNGQNRVNTGNLSGNTTDNKLPQRP